MKGLLKPVSSCEGVINPKSSETGHSFFFTVLPAYLGHEIFSSGGVCSSFIFLRISVFGRGLKLPQINEETSRGKKKVVHLLSLSIVARVLPPKKNVFREETKAQPNQWEIL